METALDRDTREVTALLEQAVTSSGLSQAGFARALSTSGSRLSTYLRGTTAPSAVFVVRARRMGQALGRAAGQGLMSAPVTAATMRRYLRAADMPWVWRSLLQGRDHLAWILGTDEPQLVDAWEAAPGATGAVQWDALLAALVDHEFTQAQRTPPAWTRHESLGEAWMPQHPFLSADRIRAQTPDWLSARDIYVPARDLVTA